MTTSANNNATETEADAVRQMVSESYTEAIQKTAGAGCCGGPAPQSAVAKLAGYTSDELEVLPADAVARSFGGGNPLAFSEVKPGDTVVDLGSGAGIDLLIAARKVGPTGHVIGVDMTDDMIERARANIAAAGLENVEVRKGIIEELPVDDNTVDWVISNCVINLSPDKPRVFGEIARVLKPGGTMQVSDIVVTDLPDWVVNSKEMYASCIAGAISEDDYLAGLRDAGLEEVEVKERIVYDATQIKAFIETDLPKAKEVFACAGIEITDEVITELADSFVGKIWSAKFSAKKPSG